MAMAAPPKIATTIMIFFVLLSLTGAGTRCRDQIEGCAFFFEDCEFMESLCARTCGFCTNAPNESGVKKSSPTLTVVGTDSSHDTLEDVRTEDQNFDYDEYERFATSTEPTTDLADYEHTEQNAPSNQSDSKLPPGEHIAYDTVDHAPLPHPSEVENFPEEMPSYDEVDYEFTSQSSEGLTAEGLTDFTTENPSVFENDLASSNILKLDKLLEESRGREDRILRSRTFDVGNMKLIGNLVQHLKAVEKDPAELARRLDSVQKMVTFYERRNDPKFVEEVLNLLVKDDLNKPLSSSSDEDIMDALLTFRG